MSVRPKGTVTFLFTDIVGSTRLWEEYPDAMREDLQVHEEMLREHILRHEGYVFKTVGDAFCAAFSSAAAAAAAAMEGQLALGAASWRVPGGIRVRMGIHIGEADYRDGDYFGPTVNAVARLSSAAHGGQILLSGGVATLVSSILPAASTLLSLGRHRLKDLCADVEVYQLAHPDLPSGHPPIVTLSTRPNNLMRQPTALIGREKELGEIGRLIAKEGGRLLTLTGPGGTGKTRIALQVAADLIDRYRDGAFFVDLSPCTDLTMVARAVGRTFGIVESFSEGTSLSEFLARILQRKNLLLVLDNFEQALSAAPFVSTLLAACPDLAVLVTSREPLHLRGEREYPVPPLGLPVPGSRFTLEALTQYEAVRLFIERAEAVKPDFQVTNESAPAVAEICSRMDGLPLAIELAAARVKFFPPEKLLERLASRLEVLKGGARDLPSRQQALRSAIDWSHELLDPEERIVFRRAAVFPGGCTVEAAEEVLPAGGGGLDVVERLVSLADKSLLRQAESGWAPRFRMLETVREYALERLEESGEEEAVRGRLAAWVSGYVSHAARGFHGPDEPRAIPLLQAEQDNITEALRLYRAGGDNAGGLRLAADMGWYWLVKLRFHEGGHWLSTFLDAAPDAGNELAKADACLILGRLALEREWNFQTRLMHSFFTRSVGFYRAAGNDPGLARALNLLAWVVTLAPFSDLPKAKLLHDEAVEKARRTGDPYTMAMVVGGVGTLRGMPLHEKELFLEEAHALAVRSGCLEMVAHNNYCTAWVYCQEKQYEKALPFALEALRIGEKINYLSTVYNAEYYLIWAYRGLGKHADAAAAALRLMEQCAESGSLAYFSTSLSNLATVALEMGKPEVAARLIGATASITTPAKSRIAEEEWNTRFAPWHPQIGFEAFDRGYREGFAMTIGDALQYAQSGFKAAANRG